MLKSIDYTTLFNDTQFVIDLLTKVHDYKFEMGSNADVEFYDSETLEQIVLMPKISNYIIETGKLPTYQDIKSMFGNNVVIYSKYDGSIIVDKEIKQDILNKRTNNFFVGMLREIMTIYQISRIYPEYNVSSVFQNDLSNGIDVTLTDIENKKQLGIGIKHDGYFSNEFNKNKKNKKDKSDIQLIIPNNKTNAGLHIFDRDKLIEKMDTEYKIKDILKSKQEIVKL